MTEHYQVSPPCPAKYAAMTGSAPGFGFSLSRVKACACGYMTRWPAAFEKHLEEETDLARALADPLLPGVNLASAGVKKHCR